MSSPPVHFSHDLLPAMGSCLSLRDWYLVAIELVVCISVCHTQLIVRSLSWVSSIYHMKLVAGFLGFSECAAVAL